MNIKEMQDEIMRIKKEKDICILAHAYQSHDIWEVADYVGDSFGLAQRAAEAPQKTMIMCGVRFMAETVKLLSPEKTVYLPEPDAGCPMADQIDYDLLAALREKNPGYTVVAYVNTTTEVKTLSDVCVTSSSAVKIVKNMPEKDILFIPDCNLGMDYAAKSDAKEFIIGTENSIVSHLQLAHPEKRFYALSKDCVCHNMKMTTLGDVYNCVVNGEGESITLTEETMQKARKSIDAMLRLG